MNRIFALILCMSMFLNAFSQEKKTEYWKNNKKKGEGTIVNGLKDGKWTYWYEDGKKWCEGTYKNDKQTGQWTYWHVNGKKWEDINYENGLNTRFYPNEQKEYEVNLVNGQRDGKWTEW
ncbi:MAG TPA: hypothetical protein PK269_06525, partial [Bacteroidales bacterium]|nr:hypothetical protein [Bacteroidales bacterium]